VQSNFSPACSCTQNRAEIRLRLHRADRATVQIRDASGRAVRLLVDGKRLPRGLTRLEWNGRNGAGTRAPDGLYRVDVQLARLDLAGNLGPRSRVFIVRVRGSA